MLKLKELFVVCLVIILGIVVLSTSNFSSKQSAIIAEVTPTYSPASTSTPTKIIWTGKIHWGMTYGRLLFENLNPSAEYKYFIAEPDDVIEDGVGYPNH